MAGYLIATYRVTNPQGYEAYVAAVLPLFAAHGVEVLVADYATEVLEGDAPNVTIVGKFASKAAARAFYQSPEYQAIIHLRTDNTEGRLILVDQWVPPA